ncbi:MAG: glycosyltransferase family 4 protein [Thermoplasmatota archaeon]
MRLAIVHAGRGPVSTFTARDIEGLRARMEVSDFRHPERFVALARIGPWLRRERPDAVYAIGGDVASYVAVRHAHRRGIPSVLSVLGWEAHAHGWRRRALAQACEAATEVIVPSRVLHVQLGVPRAQIIPHGIDTKLFTPGPKDGTVCTVGNIDGRTLTVKGFDLFFETARRMPDHAFAHVGAAPPGFEAPPNVRLWGPLPSKELLPILQKATVYCSLSRRESFGVATLEAMACGAAIVASRADNLPDLTAGEAFYADWTPESCLREVQRALAAPNGERMREVAVRYDIDRRIAALEALFRRLTATSYPVPSSVDVNHRT